MKLLRLAVLVSSLFAVCASVTAQAQRGDSSPFATQDPLARELSRSDVFVGRTMRGSVDERALRTLTLGRPADRRLKIAVLSSLPESGRRYGSGARYTEALHAYLGLKQGILIIVTRRSVYAETDALSAGQLSEILRDHLRSIQEDPVAGLQRTVEAIDARIGSGRGGAAAGTARSSVPDRDAASPIVVFFWLLVIGGGTVVAVVLIRRAVAKKQAMRLARLPVERLRGEVVTGLSQADVYLDLLPESSDAAAARQARHEAAALYEQAAGIARSARTPEDYGRAQALLEQAKEQADLCNSYVDRATGGTGFAVAVEGTDYRATPGSGDPAKASRAAPIIGNLRAKDIPEAERGACFFCSRPARISDLTPVTIALQGQRRKVLACEEDVRIVQEGYTPEVRTVEEEGQRVPWFGSRRYDPYRDYGRGDAHYAPGYSYGGSPFGGFLGGLLLGSLLTPSYAMPYPVYVNPMGQATADPASAAGTDFHTGLDGAGSADFFGTGGGGYDLGGGDFGGSEDFGGAADFGQGGIFGGAWSSDDSGSDFGGGDFGGGDFGGGDFGGGGDF
jgi:uncharacterized membrane protein YgcG